MYGLKSIALFYLVIAIFAIDGMAVGEFAEAQITPQKRKIFNSPPMLKTRKLEVYHDIPSVEIRPPLLPAIIQPVYGIDLLKYLASMDQRYSVWVNFIDNGSEVNKEVRWLWFLSNKTFDKLNLGFKYGILKGVNISDKVKLQQLDNLYHVFDNFIALAPNLEQILSHMACNIIDLMWKTKVDRPQILDFLRVNKPKIITYLPQESDNLQFVTKRICLKIAEMGRRSPILNYLSCNQNEIFDVVTHIVISLRVKKKTLTALEFLGAARPMLLHYYPGEKEFVTASFNTLAMHLAKINNLEPVLQYLKAYKDEEPSQELQDKLFEYVLQKATGKNRTRASKH